MEPEKEAQKVIESSQSGQVIKSLSDLRIDKLENKLSQIEKLNRDLIAANKELYAFVANNYTQERPAEQKASTSADMSSHQQNTLAGQVQQPSIGVVTPPTAPTDEPSVDNVMRIMGYPQNSPDGQ